MRSIGPFELLIMFAIVAVPCAIGLVFWRLAARRPGGPPPVRAARPCSKCGERIPAGGLYCNRCGLRA